MVSKRSQCADDVFDFILLKQADAGDPSRSSLQARCGVFHRDAAESEDGDLRPACFMQGGEAGRLPSGSIVFSEDWSKDGEVCTLGVGANHILVRMAGGGHEKVVSGQWPVGSLSRFTRPDIVRAQMNAIGSRSQRNVRAGVN